MLNATKSLAKEDDAEKDEDEYLREVLRSQNLADDSEELKALQDHRDKVEKLLRKHFSKCTPTIRYGGSKAKNVLNKEDYDLDIISYFPHDDVSAGETLEEIYNNTEDALEDDYLIERKTSVLRLRDRDPKNYNVDFHIDVAPGRYIDATKTDAFLHQTTGDKKRLKTNLATHIEHIRDSGVTEAIRLIRLWRIRDQVQIRNFPLDLLTVKLLKNRKTASLAKQVRHVLTEFRDNAKSLSVEDPANPKGNDLSALLDDAVRSSLTAIAKATLETLEEAGWEAVFTQSAEADKSVKEQALRRMAATVEQPAKPWST